ncbi:hypothetical protein MMC25_000330 [Agyrium rufum]|nr:hypothetical protein [Agyrium rufum]
MLALSVVVLSCMIVVILLRYGRSAVTDLRANVSVLCKFFYACFLKPHTSDKEYNGQQAALESFYKAQADVYDATRARLLRGREDMLVLVAAQFKYKASIGGLKRAKPLWVDIGGGTGWNIEAMAEYLDVPNFFSEVYLVDLSPSLCEIARKRFARLGWNNVHVVCQDARLFRLGPPKEADEKNTPYAQTSAYQLENQQDQDYAADLITLSYSLSMIPDYYSVVDSIASLLHPKGLLGVVDFYVQSIVETSGRNYIGGSLQRHVNWIGRSFWRAWFDLDRVGLEGAKRDYLEYRFGTLKSVDERNYILGLGGVCIPYYIYLGVSKSAPLNAKGAALVERLDADCTESPYLSPRQHQLDLSRAAEIPVRSKAYNSAIVNLSANLPLPSTFYQNNHWRIYYDENLPKHTQFQNEFIYGFNWEDSRVDQRVLKINSEDVMLCITSAGDNILDYLATANPRRIHAIDLNPSQNHLLELKIASFKSLPYMDFWKLFGEGKHPRFKSLLINKLSPHMSSQAFQFWLNHVPMFTGRRGLYESGGSGHALRLVRWLMWVTGLKKTTQRMCEAKTLNEQREHWSKIRRILMSRILHWIVMTGDFLWKAAGVPPAQRDMIISDHLDQAGINHLRLHLTDNSGEAMWEYIENTLAPVARETMISEENFYYLLTLQGKYSRKCHPPYLSPKTHARLSKSNAFDGLRIHTDEINEVISRITPGTLTIAIIMDSMDWFDTQSEDAINQARALNYALKLGGRVLLRSAGLKPWYIASFESAGFTARRVAARLPGTCIDRVNMYASTWILTKTASLPSEKLPPVVTAPILEKLEI